MAAKIFEKLIGINKKLGKKAKFSDVIDDKKIQAAEQTAGRMQGFFQKAIADDYSEITRAFSKMGAGKLTVKDYEKISGIAFSIKSRAGNAGIPLASKVSNNLYQFCDEMQTAEQEADAYDVIRVHIAALEEIFTARFDVEDNAKAARLLLGLDAIKEKCLKKAKPEPQEEVVEEIE